MTDLGNPLIQNYALRGEEEQAVQFRRYAIHVCPNGHNSQPSNEHTTSNLAGFRW